MSLKKQLSIIAKSAEKERKEKEQEEKRKLIRSDEDWSIIEEYLQNLLEELAANAKALNMNMIGFRRTRFIAIDCKSRSMLFPRDNNDNYIWLKDGSRLKINHEDMKRFCKEHKLKLRYLLNKDHDYEFSTSYAQWDTKTYLIEIKG